jgi:sulfur carrier protein
VRSSPPPNPLSPPELEFFLIAIHLNGELREVPENLTLSALLEWLKMPADRVAVERNRQVTPRSAWAETVIQANDQLEVVHFVGGGA